MPVRVRPAAGSDREAVLALVPRLRAFGGQALRENTELDRAEHNELCQAFASLKEGAALYVAEMADGEVAGVAYTDSQTDYFTGERHGHLGILAVAERAEGQGAGRALLEEVERWAARLGYRFITLHVFNENTRARAVYERAGYCPDTIKFAKEIRPRTEAERASALRQD